MVLSMTAACYSYVPVDAPNAPAGQIVELKISDPGRVSLAPRFGPGLDRVAGRLVAQHDTNFTVSVLSVTTIDGEQTRWSGEEVLLSRDFIRSASSRRLSPTKTALMAGAAAAVLYFTAIRPLTGGGKDPRDPPDPIEGPISSRTPAGPRLRLTR